jgi:mannan endo-1,4-beta-mannosidase
MKHCFFICWLLVGYLKTVAQPNGFISIRQQQMEYQGKPYRFIGANYWYGALLYAQPGGAKRLQAELDFLQSKGVNNLRILAAVEGSGIIHGKTRVEPALQNSPDQFNEAFLVGLDYLLQQLQQRKMHAVLYLSNNWEWSGGFLQYLNWNGRLPDSVLARQLNWDAYRDYVSGFYSCNSCIQQYAKQLSTIINRTNSFTHRRYVDDPAIMAWEIANEPRPMRPAAIAAYTTWISNMSAAIRMFDPHHLITIGSEGDMGSETMDVFEAIHRLPNIDYATIHIWPKNWSWFQDTAIVAGFPAVLEKTAGYIQRHEAAARRIGKPLVIEEFGLPRDAHAFTVTSSTTMRNRYYAFIFDQWWQSIRQSGPIAGVNFWSFAGSGRPTGKQLFWQQGNDWIGDPPVEEQGLNSVFDSDTDTWLLIELYTKKLKQ